MNDVCQHLDQIRDVVPSGTGCVECIAEGRSDWVHLRVCQECGHVGCCDNSPGKHATAHYRTVGDPIIRSYEPGEDWYYCYPDDLMFELEDAPPAPSHPRCRATSSDHGSCGKGTLVPTITITHAAGPIDAPGSLNS